MTGNEFAHLDEAAIADEGADANAAQVADDGKYLLQGLGQFDAKQVNTVWPRSRVTKAAARNTTGMWRYWTISVEAGMR